MKINELVKQVGVSESALRYWEKVGIIPVVHRNEAGIRDYDEHDKSWIEFIIKMRQSGIDIKHLQKYTKLFEMGTQTKAVRLQILKSQLEVVNAKLANLKESQKLLEWKIDHYDQIDQTYRTKLEIKNTEGVDIK